jgi:hypothetical protein
MAEPATRALNALTKARMLDDPVITGQRRNTDGSITTISKVLPTPPDDIPQGCPNCGSQDCTFSDDYVASCPECGYCGVVMPDDSDDLLCTAAPTLHKRSPAPGGPALRPAAARTAPATALADHYRAKAASTVDPVLRAGYLQLAQQAVRDG